ncbi:hypothetical protein PIB30_018104 [Stylosanthes scabra]|uniref:Uncharacterized protein n=1 Tax=Stylosanthes scabra TaxID=79078 RepID=A0ABU6Z843_9FABA|nr:hypothetical protein [Stylosanthes scabra]
MNEEQRDTADVLLWLFSERVLKAKAVLGNPECARALIVKMAGKNKTLANLRRAMATNPQGPIILSPSGGQASSSALEGGSLSNVQAGTESRLEVSSPVRGSSSVVFAREEDVWGGQFCPKEAQGF